MLSTSVAANLLTRETASRRVTMAWMSRYVTIYINVFCHATCLTGPKFSLLIYVLYLNY